MSVAQVAVSKNKRRFKDKKNKFNLDLSYIGKRLIAMGFPSEKTEALYRNPFPEVLRFFEHYHSNNYYIYNLCAEKDRIYDSEKFHGRVKHFPFYDHNAPPLQLIVDCCIDIHQWLNENDKNVAGVHCKAGKGRTGLISCCYLMMNETCKTSDDALLYYGKSRTKDGKGVTIASQIRYIKYYEKVLKNMGGVIPEALPLILTRIKVTCYPKKELKVKGDPIIVIEIADKIVHVSEPGTVEKYKKGVYKADIKVMGVVEGDVKIMLQLKKRGGGKQKLCHFWFNSGFIENYKLDLPKKDIDVANKDKNCKYFKQDFNIECFFKDPDPEELERTKKENGVIEEEEESVEENNTKTDEKEPNGGKKEKKDGRKSFYDYSDYGKIQKALEFSDEENSEAEGVVITNNQDDDSK